MWRLWQKWAEGSKNTTLHDILVSFFSKSCTNRKERDNSNVKMCFKRAFYRLSSVVYKSCSCYQILCGGRWCTAWHQSQVAWWPMSVLLHTEVLMSTQQSKAKLEPELEPPNQWWWTRLLGILWTSQMKWDVRLIESGSIKQQLRIYFEELQVYNKPSFM